MSISSPSSLNLNDPVVHAIVSARVKLLLEKPFFGNLATRLILKEADGWCKTAATDGRHLYYNREFIKGLTQAQLLFLVGHEVLHCVYDHLGRRGQRDPKIWNMANDYIVNDTLVKESVGKMPEGGLLDSKYNDTMTSEEVYELLKKNSVTIKMPLDQHLDAAGDSKGDEDGDGEGGDGDGQPKKVGSGSGGKTVDVTVMGKDGPPKLTEDDLQKIRTEVRTATIQAAQAVGAGKVPAGVKRMIEELTSPKMDWRTLLDSHIKSSVKDDYTFTKVNRRSWSLGAFLPGQDYLETVEVAVAVDTSGSMSDEMLRDILGEVKGIMETFQDFKLTLWTFDTQVYNPKEFTSQNLDDILTYDPKGGGGTDFDVNFQFMKEVGLEPHRFVMFTDGYPCGSWGDENYTDTLFVIHGNTSIVAPFGITAYYDDAK